MLAHFNKLFKSVFYSFSSCFALASVHPLSGLSGVQPSSSMVTLECRTRGWVRDSVPSLLAWPSFGGWGPGDQCWLQALSLGPCPSRSTHHPPAGCAGAHCPASLGGASKLTASALLICSQLCPISSLEKCPPCLLLSMYFILNDNNNIIFV